jgi:adenylate kinase family enzyme
MRIAVVGQSGAGKTTLARQISRALDIPFIELDAINWQAGWRDLNSHDPEAFKRRTTAALAADAWVCDGNYGTVRPLVWARATHLVWLDYSRAVVMRRVVWRSFIRIIDRTELWPGTGNRERLRDWIKTDHPIRWAWDTFARHRRENEKRLASPEHAHLTAIRLRRPGEAGEIVQRLTRQV